MHTLAVWLRAVAGAIVVVAWLYWAAFAESTEKETAQLYGRGAPRLSQAEQDLYRGVGRYIGLGTFLAGASCIAELLS